MTEASPGPYKFDDIDAILDCDGRRFAHVRKVDNGDLEDNARLLAAAHELREALQKLVDAASEDTPHSLPWYCPATTLIKQAKAALAAAEPPEAEDLAGS